MNIYYLEPLAKVRLLISPRSGSAFGIMLNSFTFLCLCLTISGLAQSTSSVRGVIKSNGESIEFANVYVTTQTDSVKIITGTVSDSTGYFKLADLVYGDYVLNIKMIGYLRKQVNFNIAKTPFAIDLGEISIESDPQLLQQVEITAIRNSIQKTEDGFVVNASANITQIGGTAADLLKNMPGVLVSSEGEITIRGKTPLTLINGRISGITGIDRAAALERIPASNIERIEIINNPSAKYAADAEGGIINIILKKNTGGGTNGAFGIGAGYGKRYRVNGSFLLNHKTEKWNFGIGYDNWYTTRTRHIEAERINYDIPEQYYLTQRRNDERLIFYQNAKANIDFTPGKKSNFNFEALWAFPGEDNDETLKNTFHTSTHDFNGGNQRHSIEIRRTHAIEFSLSYNTYFKNPDQFLSSNISNTFDNEKENTDITTQSLNEDGSNASNISYQQTHVYEKTNLANIEINYGMPISGNSSFETGYKSIFRYLNSDFGRANVTNEIPVVDPVNTDIFVFNEQIHAIYAMYTGWTGNKQDPTWKFNAGLREELVLNHGEAQDHPQEFSNEYFKLYPSASVFYYNKARNNFKFSYSKRINRPGLGQLNPFIDITDSLNQHSGNSKLKPEFVHSLELGYNHSWPKGTASASLFYRLRNNAIFPFTTVDENGVALSRPENFGRASTFGIEVVTTLNPFLFWNINLSATLLKNRIYSQELIADQSTEQVSWFGKAINNFTLTKSSKLQVIGNYTSSVVTPQGTSKAIFFADLGFQQKIMKGKGRLGLTLTDIFNTQKWGYLTSDYNFYYRRTGQQDTRAIMVNFGYTFGTSFKEKMMENQFKND